MARSWRLHMDGPDADLLTKQDVAAYLHVTERTLDRLIAAGRFPAGTRAGGPKSTELWSGADVALYLYLLRHWPRPVAGVEPEAEE